MSSSLLALKQETKLAQEAHKALVSSYQRQLLELEGLQSQINSSERIIELKQQQCVSMERELKKMASIRHPVRRLPAEVLQCIFESACDLSMLEHLKKRVVVAIRLSHVCRRWRSIATTTPRIWSVICLLLADNKAGTFHLWNLVRSRIKHAPAHIVLWNVGTADSESHLATYMLQKVAIIDRLEIYLTSRTIFNQFERFPCLSRIKAKTVEVHPPKDWVND